MTDMGNVVRAFSADHVVRLTGLSKRQLGYWDKTGFFQPRYASENRRSPFSRVYSFTDAIGLRTLGILRRDHRIPLQHLRKVARELSRYKDAPWSQLVLYVLGREVHFREPGTEQVRGVLSRQYVNLPLQNIIHDVVEESSKLRERTAEQFGCVERHRFIVHNAWAISGTRIPVRAIWRYDAAGYSAEQIIREYPSLTKRDVAAALEHEERRAGAQIG